MFIQDTYRLKALCFISMLLISHLLEVTFWGFFPTQSIYYYNIIIISSKKAVNNNQKRQLVKISKVKAMGMLFYVFLKFYKNRSIAIASHTGTDFRHLLDLKLT